MGLSKRQREILDFVESYTTEHRVSPTYQEIADHVGYRSLATVAEHIKNLARGGWLRKGYNEARSLEVLHVGDVAHPAEENGYVIHPDAKYVPVSALPKLFHAWLEKRQVPEGTIEVLEEIQSAPAG